MVWLNLLKSPFFLYITKFEWTKKSSQCHCNNTMINEEQLQDGQVPEIINDARATENQSPLSDIVLINKKQRQKVNTRQNTNRNTT